ncbi:Rap1a/Tai family immunity protein [Phenylobacterium sp.]|uniref:Rap1a/Tai family immunity protein n=1 Tax=Phenylobacterium sp. TaxID=1871053 RepID=UPI0025CF0C4B|nr:Rap1a/Tai family immunity protein [Phenylobacterium sp.]
MLFGLIALTLVTALPPAALSHPAFFDAARLQALCVADGPDAASAHALCLGYVAGAVDQLLTRQARRGRSTVCVPADLTPKAALQAVQRHARFASTAHGVGAADFVRFAMEQAYPCSGESSRR